MPGCQLNISKLQFDNLRSGANYSKHTQTHYIQQKKNNNNKKDKKINIKQINIQLH